MRRIFFLDLHHALRGVGDLVDGSSSDGGGLVTALLALLSTFLRHD